jgi:hypothetical protein
MSAAPLELHFDPTGDLLAAARECEAQVFLGAYGNTREELAHQYGPYEDSSIFLALADEGGDVIGAMRMILPSSAGLKTLNDLAGDPWGVDGIRAARAAGLEPTRSWDVATVGVRRGLGARGLFASAALYHGLFVSTRINRVPSMVTILDARVRNLLANAGILLNPLPGTSPAPYLGSKSSVPLFGHGPQMRDVHRRTNPDSYRLIGQGIGLDGVTLPAESAYLLPELRRAAIAVPDSPGVLENV